MKKLLLCVLVLVPMFAFGQGYFNPNRGNQNNQGYNQQNRGNQNPNNNGGNSQQESDDIGGLSTKWEKIKDGSSKKDKIGLSFRMIYYKGAIRLQLRWVPGGFTSISSSYDLLMRTQDGNVHQLKALLYASSNDNLKSQDQGSRKARLHIISPIYAGNLSFLGNDDAVTNLRITARQGTFNLTLKGGDAKKLNKAYKKIVKELEKE